MAAIVLSHNVGALEAPSRPQTWGGTLAGRLADFAAAGSVVRQFDEVLNELSDHYVVVDNTAFYANDHVLYWQFRASELFSNTISGLIDNRYNGSVGRERHPRYRFWQSQNVADVADRCYATSAAHPPGPPGRRWYRARLGDAAAEVLRLISRDLDRAAAVPVSSGRRASPLSAVE